MGIHKYLQQLWESEDIKPIIQNYMIRWRKEPVIVKLEKPTRLDRAHSLGYKAKNGFLIARVRIGRGGRKRMKFKGGRRSKHMRRRKVLSMSYQWVAEGRVARAFPNCEVLNSYYLAKDGINYWFEVYLWIQKSLKIIESLSGFLIRRILAGFSMAKLALEKEAADL